MKSVRNILWLTCYQLFLINAAITPPPSLINCYTFLIPHAAGVLRPSSLYLLFTWTKLFHSKDEMSSLDLELM